MIFKIALLVIVSLISRLTYAQTENPYNILRALSGEMASGSPMLDSLYPLQTLSLIGKECAFLSRKQKREIRKQLPAEIGYRVCKDSFPDKVLIPSFKILRSFQNIDSTAKRLIDEAQPFYMLSRPIFFDNRRMAIIKVALIRGFGNTYFLREEEQGWKIIKSIYGWM